MSSSIFDLDLDFSDKIPFGKYRGAYLSEIAVNDPDYLRWMIRGTDWGRDNEEAIFDALRVAALEKIEALPELSLTDHQAQIADELFAAIDRGARVVRLEGGAGYGKSYVTAAVAKELFKRGFEVRAMAVSYVATQVLVKQLDPYGVSCATVARSLRFTKDWIDGVEIYSHSQDTPEAARDLLSEGKALIVDECSMINDHDALLLFDIVQRAGGLLILVGDSAQLPPVKQEHLSRCCTGVPEDAISMLTVPMRYSAESHLYQVEQGIRLTPWNQFRTGALSIGSDQVGIHDSMNSMIQRYVSNYLCDPAALHRMLLFRRKDVIAANNTIRKALFGTGAGLVEADERLMILATTDTPYVRNQEPGDNVRYYSGQSFHVIDHHKDTYSIRIGEQTFEIPHHVVRLDDERKPIRVLFAVTESQMDLEKEGSQEFQAALSAAREYGLAEDEYGNKIGSWEPWKQLQGDFVRVAYTYATSVHRAQGQTVDYAYCAPQQLLSVPGIMGRALAYVACTRAKKHLSVLR